MIGDDVETSILESARRLCESMGVVVELRRSRIAGISLIRPDGYVAYRTRHPDGAAPPDVAALSAGASDRAIEQPGASRIGHMTAAAATVLQPGA